MKLEKIVSSVTKASLAVIMTGAISCPAAFANYGNPYLQSQPLQQQAPVQQYAQPGAQTFASPPPQFQASASFIPAGTPVDARIQGTLSSEFSRVGETFTMSLNAPIYAGGQIVAGPGSTIQGQVVSVTPAGRGGKPGSMDLRLSSIITTDGRRLPLSARVDNSRFSLSASGGRAGHFVKSTAVGAGAGALSGLIGGAISGGRKGKATAIGTGIGGGIGLLGGAVKRGKELVIGSGTSIPFLTDQPVQVNVAPPVRQVAPEFGGNPNFGGAPSGGFQDPGYQYR